MNDKERRNKVREDGFDQVAIDTRRVTKVTEGAKRFRFSSIVVVGNRKGVVGVGLAKGEDPRVAIEKAVKYAKSHLITVVLKDGTIPHDILEKYGASRVLLKPASKGRGIISGNTIRPIFELAGIKDICVKILGSSSKVNNIYCTMKALSKLRNTRL